MLELSQERTTDWVTTEILFLAVLEARIQRSKHDQCWFLPRHLSVSPSLSRLVDGHLLSVSSHSLFSVADHVQIPSFYKGNQSYWIRAHTNDFTLTQ